MLAALVLAACASTVPLDDAFRSHRVVVLGEVHDNAAQHAARLAAFDAWLAAGVRPVLVLEQFDRERQGDLDRARARSRDADEVIAAASGPRSGWDWTFYRPFVERALKFDLPIVAANVSRDDARTVIAKGLAASGFEATVPRAIEDAQADDIVASHCGQVDAALARRMASAQVARDQSLARAIEAQGTRTVVVLTGNGHARRDIGIAHWLSAGTRAQTWTVGFVERGSAMPTGAFDRVVVTDAQPRGDPCAAFKK